uniref:Aquaporin n=1 Tax=Hanusia phi TaxID=3032 RepID=A0A7S0HKA7_9CRYP|mmetsp:Transcript_29634/g.67075  ORF Transcript_29634/g.67075 Transcript_29634/m.67075 type:complete len:251 (+) Transcript_29634:122-874(+)
MDLSNRQYQQMVAAEFTGSLLFQFLAGVAAMSSVSYGLAPAALGIGFSYMVISFALRGISVGHLNPAVTVSLLVTQPKGYAIDWVLCCLYIAAQLAGSIIGMFIVVFLIPMDTPTCADPEACKPVDPLVYYSLFMARGTLTGSHGLSVFLMEFFCTSALVWVFYGTSVDPHGRAQNLAPLAIGFAMVVGVFAEGPGTGASMSPARSLAPAVVKGSYEFLFAPLAGTLLGGIVAGLVYNYLFLFDEHVPDL